MTGNAAWSADVEVDIAPATGHPGPFSIRGWARGPADYPDHPGAVPVVYCLAGGGCSTGYFDLQVSGDGTYSMADHFVRRGAVVMALDHIGIGRSDQVEDRFEITPTFLARVHDHAARELLARLRGGELGPRPLGQPWFVGMGHSMGGLITTVAQARHHTFDALALLGTGGTGLPEVLTAEELAVSGPDLEAIEADIVKLARIRFSPNTPVPRKKPRLGTFFADDVPAAVRQAFAGQAVPLLPTCGLTSMIPGSVQAERATIEVPTFLGFGDQDLIDTYMDSLSQFRNVTDAALYVLAGSGHCHNQAGGRHLIWDRILSWLETVSAR